MRIFFAERRGLDGSRAVRLLLDRAWLEFYGGDVPALSKTADGKPFFPSRSEVHVSLSHTKTHVLAALGPCPVGADIETVRPLRRGVAARVCAAAELSQFDFFELWTLKESYIKLFGAAPPMNALNFSRKDGGIAAPRSDVSARLYADAPGCAAAACTVGGRLPERLEYLDIFGAAARP